MRPKAIQKVAVRTLTVDEKRMVTTTVVDTGPSPHAWRPPSRRTRPVVLERMELVDVVRLPRLGPDKPTTFGRQGVQTEIGVEHTRLAPAIPA